MNAIRAFATLLVLGSSIGAAWAQESAEVVYNSKAYGRLVTRFSEGVLSADRVGYTDRANVEDLDLQNAEYSENYMDGVAHGVFVKLRCTGGTNCVSNSSSSQLDDVIQIQCESRDECETFIEVLIASQTPTPSARTDELPQKTLRAQLHPS